MAIAQQNKMERRMLNMESEKILRLPTWRCARAQRRRWRHRRSLAAVAGADLLGAASVSVGPFSRHHLAVPSLARVLKRLALHHTFSRVFFRVSVLRVSVFFLQKTKKTGG